MSGFDKESADHRTRDHHENIDHDRDAQEGMIIVRRHGEAEPGQRRATRAQQDIAAPSTAEDREGVGDDAGERLQVPCQTCPEKEGGAGRARLMQLVLEQVLQGQMGKNPGLGERRGENTRTDHDPGMDQGRSRPLIRHRCRGHRGISEPCLQWGVDAQARLPV